MISDDAWFNAILNSIDNPETSFEGIQLPAFPGSDIVDLTISNGKSNAMLEGAFRFYTHVGKSSASLGLPLGQNTKLLDFGCAWGRIARFFLRELPRENIYGVDVVPALIRSIESTFQSNNFSSIKQKGRLPHSDAFFDLVIANSVFSHLTPELNLQWIKEIRRVTKPGGLAMLTIIDPEKLETMALGAKDWFEQLGLNMETAREKLNNQEFFWHSTARAGELKGYGLAAIPDKWIDEHWLRGFSMQKRITDYSQTILVLQAV